MSLYKTILKHSATYGLGIVLSRLAGIIFLPVYTRYLTPADYGVMELLDLTSNAVTLLLGLHLGDAFLYYYSNAKGQQERDRTLTTAYLGAFGLGVVIFTTAVIFAPQLSQLIFRTREYAFYFRLLFAGFIPLFPESIGVGYLRFYNRSTLILRAYIVRLSIGIIVNVILLVKFHMGVTSMLTGLLAASGFMALYTGYVALKPAVLQWDMRIFGRMYLYAVPVGLSGVAMLCVNFGDRFFLQRVVPLSQIGIYALAYKIGMFVSYVQLVFNMYWTSQMFNVMKQPNGERVYSRVTTYYCFVLASGAVCFSVFAHPILRLIAAPSYADAATYVPLVAVAYLVRSVGEQLRSMLFVQKRPDLDTRVTFAGAGICLAGYFMLIPRFKLWGALVATLLGFLTMAVYGIWESQRLRKCSYEWKRIGVIGISAIGAICVSCIAHPRGLWFQMLEAVMCVGLFFLMLAAMGFFMPHEVEKLRELASTYLRSPKKTRPVGTPSAVAGTHDGDGSIPSRPAWKPRV